MGRGIMSKAVRSQNRANKAGHPNRSNSTSMIMNDKQLATYQRMSAAQEKNKLRQVIFENKSYHIEYRTNTQTKEVRVVGILNDGAASDNRQERGYLPPQRITEALCHKLCIILNVEQAMKERNQS